MGLFRINSVQNSKEINFERFLTDIVSHFKSKRSLRIPGWNGLGEKERLESCGERI